MKKQRKSICTFFVALLVMCNVFFLSTKAQAAPTGAEVVNYTKTFIGVPYLWGGTTPNGFDCSGLMQYSYGHFGVAISRTTYDQINNGIYVSRNELQLGDLIFFGTSADPHHVGMYVGDNNYIHAPKTGDYVKISSLSERPDYLTARRIISSNHNHADYFMDINELQTKLYKRGYKISFTGKWDSQTQNALLQFQKDAHICETSYLNVETAQALNNFDYTNHNHADYFMDTKELQWKLNYRGYGTTLTGTWDSQTQRSLLQFQRDAHLCETGYLNVETANALNNYEYH